MSEKKGMTCLAKIIKGSAVVQTMKKNLKTALSKLGDRKPTLAVIRIGQRPSEVSYEKSVFKKLIPLGIHCLSKALHEDISQKAFDQLFDQINVDPHINGILLLQPIPEHLSLKHVIDTIDPFKDIDCIGAINMYKVYQNGESKGFLPCTAEAVMNIIDFMGIDLVGQEVVIVGFGMVVGRPLTILLIEAGSTVTVCHEYTKDLVEECQRGELLIAAAGVAHLINAKHVKMHSNIIDVGINTDKNGHLCGDVDFEAVLPKVNQITPVPNGVGTVTTYVLAAHVFRSFMRTNQLVQL